MALSDAEATMRLHRLLANLESTGQLLTSAGESYWSAWMDGARKDLAHRDADGLRRLLGAYGGMGSFNDLILWDGQTRSASDAELARLRSSMYDDASALLRDFERA